MRGFVVANEGTSIKGNIQVDKDINFCFFCINKLVNSITLAAAKAY
jgi:hypothetical protein